MSNRELAATTVGGLSLPTSTTASTIRPFVAGTVRARWRPDGEIRTSRIAALEKKVAAGIASAPCEGAATNAEAAASAAASQRANRRTDGSFANITASSSSLALIDHPLRLADERPLDRLRRTDIDLRADPDQRLDAVAKRRGDLVAIRLRVLRQHLAAHFDCVEIAFARDDELVLPRELAVGEDDLLDLRREEVDAANDQHVVAAADDLAHPPHRARCRRQQTRQVARAVADHRQRLLGERREDELALGAVGQHGAGVGIDDLGIEVILPDDGAVLRLDALARDTGSHDLGEAVDVDRIDAGLRLDVLSHRLGPRLGAEDADLEARRRRIDALAQ